MSEHYITDRLSIFAERLCYNDIPKTVLEKIKLHILDTLGVIIAGSTKDTSKKCLEIFLTLNKGINGSIIIGTSNRLPSPWAAYVNGISSHSIELDDGMIGTQVHPGSVIIPTVLGLNNNISGKRAIEAIVSGYEVILRIGMSLFPNHRRIGFHPTGTCGTFGSAIAASKVMSLNMAQIINALAYAGTQAMALREGNDEGSFIMKRTHAGKAAHNGILSALFAAKGLKGPGRILEGEHGFLKLVGGGGKPELIIKNLGEDFVLSDCYFKAYAACRHIHSPIDSLLLIKNKHDINNGDINRIVLKIYEEGSYFNQQKPDTPVDAQFSIPYSLAVALTDGTALLPQYEKEKLSDSKVMELSKKITVEVDEGFDYEYTNNKIYANEVIMYLNDGTVLKGSSKHPLGSPGNPMNEKEVINKFLMLGAIVYSKEHLEKIANQVLNLEKNTDLKELTRLLILS